VSRELTITTPIANVYLGFDRAATIITPHTSTDAFYAPDGTFDPFDAEILTDREWRDLEAAVRAALAANPIPLARDADEVEPA
jgi:hypothetical protein